MQYRLTGYTEAGETIVAPYTIFDQDLLHVDAEVRFFRSEYPEIVRVVVDVALDL